MSAPSIHATWPFRLTRQLGRFILHALFRIEVQGLRNIPPAGSILAGNHLSWADPFLIMILFPITPRVYFLAPRETVLNRAWKAWIMGLLGRAIFYERSQGIIQRQVIEQVSQLLAAGGVLGIFPEGGVGQREGELLPLKKGIGHFALESGRPILPIAFSGTQELYLRKTIRVIIGRAFVPKAKGETYGDQVESITAQVESALRAILPTYREEPGVVKRWRWLNRLFR
ncbi:MAG: 1-acyl-sn-glycerol-3-phosphate acyltransferase [Chloroflexi bacterium]|nr:1-acyl-sn-glycerol-3-phosphate acyltransferase [Chloroflexota bacterium]